MQQIALSMTAAGERAQGRPWQRLALACGLMLAAAPALAQINPNYQPAPRAFDNDDDPVRSSSGVPGLDGYPGRGLLLDLKVSSIYDSNLARQPIADDGLRIRPEVNARYGLGSGRLGLFAQGTYGRDIVYGTNRFPAADRVMVGGGLDMKLARCSLQAGGSWRRSLAFQTEATLFGGFQQEAAQAGLTGSCRIGGGLGINGSVLRSDFRTSRANSQAFNLNSWNYSLGLSLGSAALGQFSLTGSYSDSRMPGRLVVTPTGLFEDGLRQKSVRLGYARNFGPRIALTFGVSYLDTKPKLAAEVLLVDGVPQVVDRAGFSGLGYDGALDFTFTPRLGMQLTAARSVFANSLVGAQFTVTDVQALSFDYKLSSRYSFLVGAERRNNEYRGAFISGLDPTLRRNDEFSRIFGSMRAQLGQRIQLSLDVAHSLRRSNPAILNFNSTSVGLTLGLKFGRAR